MCVQVCECVFTHLSCNGPLWGCYEGCWEESPDHGTFDVPKHVGDLLMSDEHILHM